MATNDTKEQIPNNQISPGGTDGIEVKFYTDPLCCWTWAMQPQWDQFLAIVDRPIKVTYKMGGLLPSWKHYHDALNSITKPIQMGPEWMHAKAVGGVPINDRIWLTDPPESSFPACIAVKAVELQSEDAAAKYFFLLQEAVMVQGLNIARTPVLITLADRLAGSYPHFDPFLFRNDLFGERARQEFSNDLQETRYFNISRFPTLLIKIPGTPPFLLNGFQTRDSLQAAFSINTEGFDLRSK